MGGRWGVGREGLAVVLVMVVMLGVLVFVVVIVVMGFLDAIASLQIPYIQVTYSLTHSLTEC